ncbi:MAG: glycosyltransferase [Thalassolituus sp.]|jgi:glycosyltransferase involved in cell wall biosynthesis
MSRRSPSYPLVTVYIPTYNRPDMLARAVLSVVNQTYKNIEILVVDDNSDIQTQEKLKALSETYSFTLLHNRRTKGACGARNTAITKAKGHYITGLDDDDEFLPNRIEEMVTRFDMERFSAIATTTLVRKSANETVVRNADKGVLTLDDQLHYNKVGNQVLTLTERLKDIGGFDEYLPSFQDYDAWIRLSHHYGPILKIDHPSYLTHTEHENRISTSSEKKQQGLKLFKEKHSPLLSKQHIQSLSILSLQHSSSRASLTMLLPLISKQNWKSAVSFYLDSNFSSLTTLLRKLKMKLKTRQ